MAESRLSGERYVIRSFGHVDAAKEVLVVGRSYVSRVVVLQILKVRFDHGVHVAHLRHEEVLTLYHAIHDLVERDGGCWGGGGGLRGSRGRSHGGSRCGLSCGRGIRG